jgi:hypothetical protein
VSGSEWVDVEPILNVEVGEVLNVIARLRVYRPCGPADDALPAKAGPTKTPRTHRGTGFSREEAGVHTRFSFAVASDAFPAKASPAGMRAVSGTGFSREEAGVHTRFFAP